MNKVIKKLLSIVLSVVIFSALGTSVMASDISPRNTLLNTYSCYITDKNNDTAQINVIARGISSVKQIDVTVEVQVKGLFGYSTDQTLTDTFYSNTGTYNDTISIDSSKTYRLYVTYTATSSSGGTETVTKTSATT